MNNVDIQMYATSLAALWSQLHTYIIHSQFQVQLWREHDYLGLRIKLEAAFALLIITSIIQLCCDETR